MLDEPSAGLSPQAGRPGVRAAASRSVRDSGVTILLVEQNVKAALAIADRAAVLVEGRERVVGRPPSCARARIAELYLGRHVARPPWMLMLRSPTG
jgi:branched-chain amino acid transport system ATP-binding protein